MGSVPGIDALGRFRGDLFGKNYTPVIRKVAESDLSNAQNSAVAQSVAGTPVALDVVIRSTSDFSGGYIDRVEISEAASARAQQDYTSDRDNQQGRQR